MVRSHSHLGILLHQLLLRLFPPLILVLLFVLWPLFRILRLFGILPLFSDSFQDNHDLLPASPNARDPLLPHTRPTPLRPLHLIDPLRLPHPFIHVPIRLQPLKKLPAIPWRKIGCFALLVHCCYWNRLLGCGCSGAKIWRLRGEDTCTWWDICRCGACKSRFLRGRIDCGGEGCGRSVVFVMTRFCSERSAGRVGDGVEDFVELALCGT